MTGAAFIILITVFVAGLFCAAFALIALYDREYASAKWFAAAYAAGVAYAVAEFLLPYFSDLRFGVFVGHMAFLVALTLLNVGLARRYGVVVPVKLIATAFLGSVLASILLQEMPRGSLLRMFLYQTPYFTMQAIGALIVLRSRSRRPIDLVLVGFLVVSASHYLAKPLFAVGFGGVGSTPQDYLGTTYAMISQSMGAVMVVATALLLLTTLALDVLSRMTTKSETDLISGLLNRRGFEERLAEIIGSRVRSGMPSVLVMCDLDYFKAVNDTYGHAFGDRVIALFAETLRNSTASHHVAGRIGGEEFAVILPGSNLAAGRLFAETVRTTFSEKWMAELAPGERLTASFGVAEMTAGETVTSIMARADEALYEAKRAGRDCVRSSPVLKVVENGRMATGS